MKTAIKYPTICLLQALAIVICVWTTASFAMEGPGFSYGNTVGKNDECLRCHADVRIMKSSYMIDQNQFAHTTHSKIGCRSCHDAISKGHPDGKATPRSNCHTCHAEITAEYAKSNHAGKAPCAGCHNPHKANKLDEISGRDINRMCAGCHKANSIMATHAKWLPQAELHINMLPCITCHTGSNNYVVAMYIVNRKNEERFGKLDLAGYDELKKMCKGDNILRLIDVNGDNYISLAELKLFNSNPAYKTLHLQGMMTPEVVTHSFQILDNRRDCTFCHAAGPGAMQTSYIALPEENGTYRRVAVEKGAVLDALFGTPNFYMMGSSRNSNLNIMGLAIIAGGLVMPVGHGFLRFLTKKNRK